MTKGKRSISQRYEPNVVKNPYQGVKRSFRAGIARVRVISRSVGSLYQSGFIIYQDEIF